MAARSDGSLPPTSAALMLQPQPGHVLWPQQRHAAAHSHRPQLLQGDLIRQPEARLRRRLATGLRPAIRLLAASWLWLGHLLGRSPFCLICGRRRTLCFRCVMCRLSLLLWLGLGRSLLRLTSLLLSCAGSCRPLLWLLSFLGALDVQGLGQANQPAANPSSPTNLHVRTHKGEHHNQAVVPACSS
jgi:hypothetical protein